MDIELRPLTPQVIKKARALIRRLAASHRQNLQSGALEKWWRREIAGRYLGEC
ncbi:MAG: hypothetical protein ACYDHF_06290 [Candidatus Cryosericum sp.]